VAKIDIMNTAINLLGEELINSPTQATKAASRANKQYEAVRDSVLRSHIWNFAVKRRQLSASSTDPVFHWSYAFPLPSDFIRVAHVSDNGYDYVGETGPEWEINYHEGVRCIMIDSATCYLKYVARVTDEALFDPLFTEAFASKLAAEIAYALTQDLNLYNSLLGRYQLVLRRAKSIDSQEGNYDRVVDDEWMSSRRVHRPPR